MTLNAKPFQMTKAERAYYVESARLSVKAHDAPFCIFFDTSGSVRIEQWYGRRFGGGWMLIVIPAWVQLAA